MKIRLVSAPLLAVLLATFTVVGGSATGASAGTCASSNKSIGGAFTGEDGRRLSAAIGVVIFDAAGAPINAQGCPKQPGDDSPTGYSFYTLVNSVSGCCFQLPAGGANPSDGNYANTWRIDGLPDNAVYAWVEAYPKSAPQHQTDYSRYGGAMRRMVPVNLSNDIRLPLGCGSGGNTGSLTGHVRRGGAPVTVNSAVAFSLAAEGTGQILGFVASNDAGTADGRFSIPSLASNQNYALELHLSDGSDIWYENNYGGGAPVSPCAPTQRTFDVMSDGTAVAINAVDSGPGVVDTGNGGTIFFRGADGQLWMRWVGSTAEAVPLGGQIIGEPDATTWGGGRIDVVARGTDNAVWHRWYDGGNWGPWESLGGGSFFSPSTVSWGGGRLDVFVTGTDQQLWQKAWSPGGWTSWIPMGGGLSSAPDAAAWAPNRLDLVARGLDGALWHRAWYGEWGGWESLGGQILGGGAAVSSTAGRLDIIVRGTDDTVFRKTWNAGWTGWSPFGGGKTDSDPDAMANNGKTTVVVRGGNTQLYYAVRSSPDSGFTGWTTTAG